jgi:hypothetical protein
MTIELLEPRTEPRRPAHSPQWSALTAARPAPQALPPERCEPAAPPPPAGGGPPPPAPPAAHASPAWAAPLYDATAEARVAEANAHVEEPGARVARTLCVLVRCALDHPVQTRVLARRFPASGVARRIRRDVTEGWALGSFSARDLQTAELAALGVVEIALQRALDCGPDPATPLITRELAFGLLRALGLPDSVAGAHARDAALEILIASH